MSLRFRHNFTPSLTLFIFLRIIIIHQNPTPNSCEGLTTHVGTILGSHKAFAFRVRFDMVIDYKELKEIILNS